MSKDIKLKIWISVICLLLQPFLLTYFIKTVKIRFPDPVCKEVKIEFVDTIPKSNKRIVKKIVLIFDDNSIVPLKSNDFRTWGIYFHEENGEHGVINKDQEKEVLNDVTNLFIGKKYKDIGK